MPRPCALHFCFDGRGSVRKLLEKAIESRIEPDTPEGRTRTGQLVGIISIAANIALAALKAIIGYMAGSVAVIADAVNNLTDIGTNVVSLAGFALAAKPADEEHPFGHGRFEYLATLAVSVIVCAIGLNLIFTSIARIMHPEPVGMSVALLTTLVASIAVKLWMMAFNDGMGSVIDSSALKATAIDSRNDAIATAAILVCVIIEHFTGLGLDGWAGLGVGLFVTWSGLKLVREAVDPLLGHAADEELATRVRKRILAVPGARGVHDLMIHDYGPGRLFASAHIEFAADVDLVSAHELLDACEQDLLATEGIVITLHLDPIVDAAPEEDE